MAVFLPFNRVQSRSIEPKQYIYRGSPCVTGLTSGSAVTQVKAWRRVPSDQVRGLSDPTYLHSGMIPFLLTKVSDPTI